MVKKGQNFVNAVCERPLMLIKKLTNKKEPVLRFSQRYLLYDRLLLRTIFNLLCVTVLYWDLV